MMCKLYPRNISRYEVITEKDGTLILKIKTLSLKDEAVYSCIIGERETTAKVLVDEGH